MTARDLPLTKTRKQLHGAAISGQRVRIRGTVAAVGHGYSGTYRNVWLRITFGATTLRVTASPSSRLGTTGVGTAVELAARLTGIVDPAAEGGVYFAWRAKLLS